MKKIKLPINKNTYFILRYNFDIKKYINGDINVDLYFQNKRLFTYITQLKYFIELLIKMSNLLIKQDKVLESSCNQNLLDDYVALLKREANHTDNIESKILLDLDNNGFLVFLFWQNENFYIEIVEMSLDLDTDNNIKGSEISMILKFSLQKGILFEWIKILNQIEVQIGSKLNR